MSATLISLSLLAGQALAQSYSLSDTYSPDNFFSKFDFFTGGDPTHGFVDYVDYNTAVSSGLIGDSSQAKWGVDNTNTLSTSSAGRPSVRLTSKTTYNHGLFIADFAHMPDSTCGLWPAYWFLGQTGTWPNSGELDVIEGVNSANTNLISGHTKDGCTITSLSSQTANQQGNNCAVSAGTTGCTNSDSRTDSYGSGFNSAGGGIYAMDWTSSAISVWFFPRDAIPASITSGSPDPSADFGNPTAHFAGGCDIDEQFFDMAIVFDTTFCGDWAGATYQTDGCSMFNGQDSMASCTSYVAQNPSAFKNAYWDVNSIKVYTQGGDGGAEPSGSASSSSYSAATSSSSSEAASSSAPTSSSTTTTLVSTTLASSTTTSAAPPPASTSAPAASTTTTAGAGGWHGHTHSHRARPTRRV